MSKSAVMVLSKKKMRGGGESIHFLKCQAILT